MSLSITIWRTATMCKVLERRGAFIFQKCIHYETYRSTVHVLICETQAMSPKSWNWLEANRFKTVNCSKAFGDIHAHVSLHTLGINTVDCQTRS